MGVAIGTMAFHVPEVQAACIGGDSVCTTFDPTTASTPTNIGGFTGTTSPPAPVGVDTNYTQARILFTITNTTSSFSISGLSLAGDGINTTLSFAPVSITGDGSFETSFQNLNTAITYPNSFDFANSRISFTIPSGLNIGTQILADIQYTSFNGSRQVSTSGGTFITTAASAVPGPLPLLGAGAAFGFSRTMRKRIKAADQA